MTAESGEARNTRSATSARRPKSGPATAKHAESSDSLESGKGVTAAVRRDLAAIRKLDASLADSALAALALALAAEIDDDNSATSKSMNGRVLLDTLATLRELAPVEAEKDSLDDIARRRAARIAGHPAS